MPATPSHDHAADSTTARIEAHIQLGRSFMKSKAWSKATDQFHAALALDPNHAATHIWFAVALTDMKRYDEAHTQADTAIALEPGNAFFVYVKGVVFSCANCWGEALPWFQQAVALAPEAPPYHVRLAVAYYHLQEFERCEAAARHTLTLDPNVKEALHYLALIFIQSGRVKEAYPLLEHALQVDPDYSDTHFALGLYYLHSNETARALQHTREALRIKPDNQAAQQILVEALSANNKFLSLCWKVNFILAQFQWARAFFAIIGSYAVLQTLYVIAVANPGWDPVLKGVGILYLIFSVYIWGAPAIFRWWLRRSQSF